MSPTIPYPSVANFTTSYMMVVFRQFDSIGNCRDRVIAANATNPALNLTFLLTLPQCYEHCGTGYGIYDT